MVVGDLGYDRAGPVVKFGACAIGRREYALGLEAIQNGVSYDLQHGGTWTSDRENCQFIATQYDRAAQCINWSSGKAADWNNEQTRVAIIVSSIADEDPSGKMIRALAKYHDSRRFRLMVYSTEAGVRREKQQFGQSAYVSASAKRGQMTIGELAKHKIWTWQAPPGIWPRRWSATRWMSR